MNQRVSGMPFDMLKAESFIRGEATLSVVCDQPFETVAARLQSSVKANGMVVLKTHDLDRLLAAKGIEIGFRCRVYEVFDAALAGQLLVLDAGLGHVLPCRISMHDQGGVVTVVTPMPTALMTEFSHAADVARLARVFEAALQRVLRGLR